MKYQIIGEIILCIIAVFSAIFMIYETIKKDKEKKKH